MQSILNIN